MNDMKLYRTLLLIACSAAAALAAPVSAKPGQDRLAWIDRPRDQDRAFRATQEGRAMPLPMIERKVRPFLPGAEYLGPELRGSGIVRLKFMQNGQVLWVDVDAATGRIVGRSGN
jgi:hypothetical protein